MLVSSVSTVTLTPAPHISFNIRLPSRTWDAARAAGGTVWISPLADARTARWWAEEAPRLAEQTLDHQEGGRDSAAAEFDRMLREPLRRARPWALKCVVCEDACGFVGDHVVVVARVAEVVDGDPEGVRSGNEGGEKSGIGLESEQENVEHGGRDVLVWRNGDVHRVESESVLREDDQ